MTREKITKPNFFIVGAQKSGTTSLFYYLKQHPDIYMCPRKEPAYFMPGKGIDDYDIYLKGFKGAGKSAVIGEASTGYLYDKHAVLEIHNKFPDARIVIILRNPVDMAFSLWNHMRRNGAETKSFEGAISDSEISYRRTDDFVKSLTSHELWVDYLYLDKALYYDQVKRYLDIFGRKRVKIYLFEDFIDDPVSVCQDVFLFLGIDSTYTPDCRRIANEGGEVRSRMIKRLFIRREYPILRALLPLSLKVGIREFVKEFNTRQDKKPRISDSTRTRLDDFFRVDIVKLADLIDKDLTRWLDTK